jgi:hypothetical protein
MIHSHFDEDKYPKAIREPSEAESGVFRIPHGKTLSSAAQFEAAADAVVKMRLSRELLYLPVLPRVLRLMTRG